MAVRRRFAGDDLIRARQVARPLPIPPGLRIAEGYGPAVDDTPVTASNSSAAARLRPRASAPRTMASASGCSEPALERSGEPEHVRLVVAGLRQDRDELGLADGQRAGLIDDERVDLREGLERLGVPDQHAGLGAAAGRGHDRDGRREAERAGTGDDQHRDRRDQRIGQHRRRPPDRPGGERQGGDPYHRRHEPAGDGVGELLDWRPRALRRRDHLDDPGEHRVLAGALRLDSQAAGAVDRRAGHRIARDLLDRRRLAGQHGLIDREPAVEHLTVDRDLLARAHAQPVAEANRLERDFLLAPIRPDDAGGLGGEIEPRPDRRAGALAGPQLKDLAEQHQNDDDRAGLEIDPDLAGMVLEAVREQTRRDHRTTLNA